MKKVLLTVLALVLCAVPVLAADVADLVKKLKSADSDQRRAAAKELADAGPEAKAALPALRTALKDKDLFVRRFSAEAIGAIGPDASPAVPDLRKALSDKRKEVAEAAVGALGKIGPAAVTTLIGAVRDTTQEPGVRKKAIEALGAMAPAGREAIGPLTDLIKPGKAKKGKKAGDPADVRAEVAAALGNLANSSDTEAIQALSALAGQKLRDKVLIGTIREALAKIRRRKA